MRNATSLCCVLVALTLAACAQTPSAPSPKLDKPQWVAARSNACRGTTLTAEYPDGATRQSLSFQEGAALVNTATHADSRDSARCAFAIRLGGSLAHRRLVKVTFYGSHSTSPRAELRYQFEVDNQYDFYWSRAGHASPTDSNGKWTKEFFVTVGAGDGDVSVVIRAFAAAHTASDFAVLKIDKIVVSVADP